MEMDSYLYTHAREQRSIRRGIELDVDGDALAYFRVVATTVIRCWQQRELTSSRSNNLRHMTGDRVIIGVDMDIYGLPGGNAFDRAFIDISGDLHSPRVHFLSNRCLCAYKLTNDAWKLHNHAISGGNQMLYGQQTGGLYRANDLFGAYIASHLDIQVNQCARGRRHNVYNRACHQGIVGRVEVVIIVEGVATHA